MTELRDMPASAPDAAVNGPDAPVAMIERVVTIPADHPSLPGHFPGRPIVPAVVILDEVRSLIAETTSSGHPSAIDYCKFQDFVLPDRPFRVALEVAGETVGFSCLADEDGRMLAKGRFRFETTGTTT